MKEVVVIAILIACVVFITLPASLGYWFILTKQGDAFIIPFKYWILPLISVIVYGILSTEFGRFLEKQK